MTFLNQERMNSPSVPGRVSRSCRDALGLEVLREHSVRAKDGANKPHRDLTDGAQDRVGPLFGETPLAPRKTGGTQRGRRIDFDAGSRGEFQGGSGLIQIPRLPAWGKDPCVANHLEVLVGDMANEAADKGEHRQVLEGGFTSLGIVPEREAHMFAVVVGDAVLGQYGPLGIATNIAHCCPRVDQAGADMNVPGHSVKLRQQTAEERILFEEGALGGESQLSRLVGLTKTGNAMIAPHLLQPRLRYQPALAIGLDPLLAIQRQTAFGDQQVNMRVPLQIPAKGMEDDDDPHPHTMLVVCPLAQALVCGSHHDVQTHLSVERGNGPQVPWHRHHQMMVRHVEQFVEHPVGPAICGQLATGRTEARLAGMGNDLGLSTATLIEVASQDRCTTGHDSADVSNTTGRIHLGGWCETAS